MTEWNIKRVIDQITGRDFAKSVLEKDLESSDETTLDVVRGISNQWGGKFREKFIARQGHSWQAERAIEAMNMADLDSEIEAAFQSAFVAHLMTQRVDMITDFLDSLGIPHAEGRFKEEDVTELDVSEVEKAVAIISDSYSLLDVRMYLAVAGINDEFWSTAMWASLDQLVDEENLPDENDLQEQSDRLPDAVIPEHSTILDDLMTVLSELSAPVETRSI